MNRDGTGPEGRGPKTGRGLGPCKPGENKNLGPNGIGRGRGGTGRGLGRERREQERREQERRTT